MPSSFLDKFDVRGPTLTLVLRDPSTTTLLASPHRGGQSASERHRRRPPPPEHDDAYDDGIFGLSSKVAALFHIGTTNGQTSSTSSSSALSSHYPNGYMRDDGMVISDPSCDSTSDGGGDGSYSIRDARRMLSGGMGSWGESLTRCARSVHPELRFGLSTRDDREEHGPPLLAATPWITGASCEATWSPFPIHEVDVDGGYGHEMMSAPRVVRVGARVSIPRVVSLSTLATTRWFPRRSTRDVIGVGGTATIANDDGDVATMKTTTTTGDIEKKPRKEVDFGMAYRRGRRRGRSGGGTLEIVLGGIGSDLPPSAAMRSDETKKLTKTKNQLLVRLAVGGGGGGGTKVITGDTLEYIRGSFRLPNPLFFLRGKGMSVMPSYNFVEGSARCVLSSDVGSTGRTRAVLRLDADDSTLTIVRALDERRVFLFVRLSLFARPCSDKQYSLC
jgi:hypothetical protein